jgi:hypothetical protein
VSRARTATLRKAIANFGERDGNLGHTVVRLVGRSHDCVLGTDHAEAESLTGDAAASWLRDRDKSSNVVARVMTRRGLRTHYRQPGARLSRIS